MGLPELYRKMSPPIAAGLYYSGLVPLCRWWTQHVGPRLVILNYHRADANLRSHLLYLRKCYRILSLEVALEELYSPAQDQSSPSDTRTALVITFDDGYYDNYTHASALARELRIPISIFLPSGYIESGARFHWLEGDYLARHAQVEEATIAARTYHLACPEERKQLAQALDDGVRYARSVAARETLLATARTTLSVPASTPPDERPARPLSWMEVQEMEADGWVTYGAHTVNHPLLSCLADPAEVWYEVVESRKVVETRLGHPVRTFAYPFGRPRDIGDQTIQAVRQAGFSWAVTTVPGFNTPRTNPYLLRRMPTDVAEHWLVLAAQAAGLWWGVLDPVMRLLGVPVDTGARRSAPLLRYRLWEELTARVRIGIRHYRMGAVRWRRRREPSNQVGDAVGVNDV